MWEVPRVDSRRRVTGNVCGGCRECWSAVARMNFQIYVPEIRPGYYMNCSIRPGRLPNTAGCRSCLEAGRMHVCALYRPSRETCRSARLHASCITHTALLLLVSRMARAAGRVAQPLEARPPLPCLTYAALSTQRAACAIHGGSAVRLRHMLSLECCSFCRTGGRLGRHSRGGVRRRRRIAAHVCAFQKHCAFAPSCRASPRRNHSFHQRCRSGGRRTPAPDATICRMPHAGCLKGGRARAMPRSCA